MKDMSNIKSRYDKRTIASKSHIDDSSWWLRSFGTTFSNSTIGEYCGLSQDINVTFNDYKRWQAIVCKI